ncbi:unnamed protein product [Paramecium sonneborni]|uniref:Choline transporter-like protein n=1 Tax=Paramecium sonneborni TaxID=65129 RepID=A0A8S1NMQ4_9CILI|nr:unnamed protein product [Paramecium sonneborni]
MSNKVLLADYNNHGQQQFDYPEQDVYYTGRKLDQELKRGPIESRGCRDFLCVILYLGLWALMIFCAINSWDEGDTSKIYLPYDSEQRQCGKGDLKSYSNIYILSQSESYCVSDCPGESGVGKELPCYQCKAQTAPYASVQVLTLCFPSLKVDEQYQKLINDLVEIGGFQKHYADLEETWPIILASAGIAFFMAILLTFLIRIAAGCIVWGMILIYLLIVGAIGTVAYLQSKGHYQEYRVVDDTKQLEIIAYLFWSIGGLSLLIILCLAKKISQAIQVLKTAADFTREEWQTLFVPVIILILGLGFFIYWIIFSALIYSTSSDLNKSQYSPYVELQWDAKTGWQLAIYFFGLIWNICFALSLCQFVISSCCCMWYYSHIGYPLKSSILKSFCRGFTTNFGSLLFGSLILAIVWTIKFILDAFHKQLKQSVSGDNNALGYALRCAKYYVSCFEKFIRFLNQNAYTMMALTGQSFCNAAYDAFYLILRNATRVAITHGLGELFEFLGAIFISATTSFICYLIITKSESYKNNIFSPIAPTFAFVVVSYMIGKMFMNLYGMGVDTLLICYIVDTEMNKNEGGAKSVPNSLKQYASELN